MTLLLIDNTLC